jgi:hypothetical protein
VSFIIRVECRDCGGGEDPQGCFGGAWVYWGNPDDAGRPFTTAEAAASYACRKIDGAPWDYEVVPALVLWTPDWP